MKNVSLNKEALKINVGKQYMVIDALYLSDIKNGLSEIDSKKLLPEIREKIFSYTDTPFAIYIPIDSRFDISRLKTVDYSQVVIGDTSFFSTDTGLLILIELDILVEFVRNYDYGELVDSDNEVINSGYWDLLTENIIHKVSV